MKYPSLVLTVVVFYFDASTFYLSASFVLDQLLVNIYGLASQLLLVGRLLRKMVKRKFAECQSYRALFESKLSRNNIRLPRPKK